jgi:hypothetical protein
MVSLMAMPRQPAASIAFQLRRNQLSPPHAPDRPASCEPDLAFDLFVQLHRSQQSFSAVNRTSGEAGASKSV